MEVSTANVADACMRLAVGFNVAPPAVRPLFPSRVLGRALPATHLGSVDAFFEALDRAEKGDVLVIDNQNRQDEGCIGDLTVLEAQAYGVAAVVVWGAHRDSAELVRIGIPIFSSGMCPAGPRAMREGNASREACRFAGFTVTRDEVVIADEDGLLFVPRLAMDDVLRTAISIRDSERRQAERVREGITLHAQFDWGRYVSTRRSRPDYSFREHLKTLGGAIEI